MSRYMASEQRNITSIFANLQAMPWQYFVCLKYTNSWLSSSSALAFCDDINYCLFGICIVICVEAVVTRQMNKRNSIGNEYKICQISKWKSLLLSTSTCKNGTHPPLKGAKSQSNHSRNVDVLTLKKTALGAWKTLNKGLTTCEMVLDKKGRMWDISYKFGWLGTWDVRIERNTTVPISDHTTLTEGMSQNWGLGDEPCTV